MDGAGLGRDPARVEDKGGLGCGTARRYRFGCGYDKYTGSKTPQTEELQLSL